jgi:hypothetical protein
MPTQTSKLSTQGVGFSACTALACHNKAEVCARNGRQVAKPTCCSADEDAQRPQGAQASAFPQGVCVAYVQSAAYSPHSHCTEVLNDSYGVHRSATASTPPHPCKQRPSVQPEQQGLYYVCVQSWSTARSGQQHAREVNCHITPYIMPP